MRVPPTPRAHLRSRACAMKRHDAPTYHPPRSTQEGTARTPHEASPCASRFRASGSLQAASRGPVRAQCHPPLPSNAADHVVRAPPYKRVPSVETCSTPSHAKNAHTTPHVITHRWPTCWPTSRTSPAVPCAAALAHRCRRVAPYASSVAPYASIAHEGRRRARGSQRPVSARLSRNA